MTQMWIVGGGEYSDKYNICVCVTEEVAVRLAGALDAWVDDVPLYDSMPEVVDLMTLQLVVNADGEDRQSTSKSWLSGDPTRSPITEPWEHHDPQIADPFDRAQVPCRHDVYGVRDYQGNWYVEVTVSGIDHARVRRVFSEQVARAKAEWDIFVQKAKAK